MKNTNKSNTKECKIHRNLCKEADYSCKSSSESKTEYYVVENEGVYDARGNYVPIETYVHYRLSQQKKEIIEKIGSLHQVNTDITEDMKPAIYWFNQGIYNALESLKDET